MSEFRGRLSRHSENESQNNFPHIGRETERVLMPENYYIEKAGKLGGSWKMRGVVVVSIPNT